MMKFIRHSGSTDSSDTQANKLKQTDGQTYTNTIRQIQWKRT